MKIRRLKKNKMYLIKNECAINFMVFTLFFDSFSLPMRKLQEKFNNKEFCKNEKNYKI